VGLTSQEERGQVAIPIDNLITGEWEVVGSKGDSQYGLAVPRLAGGTGLMRHRGMRRRDRAGDPGRGVRAAVAALGPRGTTLAAATGGAGEQAESQTPPERTTDHGPDIPPAYV